MDLGGLGEFGLLARVREWVATRDAIVGPGDDAAVLPVSSGASLVATTDLLVEGTHFRLEWSTPADVGYKAAAVNVSDLAAMGATPRFVLVGLGAGPETAEELVKGLYAGLGEAGAEYGTEVAGGDVVRSDRLLLAVTALGELDGPPMTRTGARPGDVLAVTGPLGRAATGVNLLLSQDPRGASPEDALSCMRAHRRPRARVAEGRALRAAGVHAAIDVSDGLSSDVRRLAEASGVGAEIDRDAVPVAPEARRIAERRGWDVLRLVLGGGEDYELLVALPPERLESAGIDLLPVGRVVEGGLWLVRGGDRAPLPDAGWDHFRTLAR